MAPRKRGHFLPGSNQSGGVERLTLGALRYKTVVAFAEADPSFHPGEVLVADTIGGKPLDAHSGAFKLVVTEDRRPARSVRNLVSAELRSVQ